MWSMGLLIYIAAAFHRASLGVASMEAADRFGVGPAALSALTVLQIGLYALMQVPTGLLVDRFGPRRVLTASAVLMGAGQLVFALADSYPLGLLARAVLGIGDAMTLVSVLRLAATHFPAHRYAGLATMTVALGLLGNLAATVPLAMLLGGVGWTITFAIAGGATVAYAAVLMLRLRDEPHGPVPRQVRPSVSLCGALREVRQSWRVPGTRLGFWVHFATKFPPVVLALLWGFPYLVQAHGLSAGAASAMLSALVLGALVAGPLIGSLINRHPGWRLPFVVIYLAITLVTWAVLLGWPGPAPVALLVAAFSWLSLGHPASSVAFALARDHNPAHRMGTATGMVNVGGFVAVTVSALAIGLLLDLTGSFRIALLPVLVLLILGTWRTAVWWRRTRATADVRPIRPRQRWGAEALAA
jgi:MFS family permease